MFASRISWCVCVPFKNPEGSGGWLGARFTRSRAVNNQPLQKSAYTKQSPSDRKRNCRMAFSKAQSSPKPGRSAGQSRKHNSSQPYFLLLTFLATAAGWPFSAWYGPSPNNIKTSPTFNYCFMLSEACHRS